MSKQHICSVCGAQNLHLYKKKYLICKNCDSIFSIDTYKDSESSYLNHFTIETLYKSIVEINTYVNDVEYNGTGIVISKNGTILTSHHVIFPENAINKEPNVIIVQKRDHNKIYNAHVLSYDKDQDIALIKTEETLYANSVIFSKNDGKPGDRIYVIGNSKGEGLCVLDGIISDINRKINNLQYFMITAPVTNGCSGAPVLDSNGELIGMVSAGRDDNPNMNYALPQGTLKSFINSK